MSTYGMHVCVPTIFKYTNNLSASRDHEIAALSELGNKHSGEVNSLVIEVRAFNGQRYRRMLTMQHRILYCVCGTQRLAR